MGSGQCAGRRDPDDASAVNGVSREESCGIGIPGGMPTSGGIRPTSPNAVSRELQVPRSLPRVGDAAKWIATGPWGVYGE